MEAGQCVECGLGSNSSGGVEPCQPTAAHAISRLSWSTSLNSTLEYDIVTMALQVILSSSIAVHYCSQLCAYSLKIERIREAFICGIFSCTSIFNIEVAQLPDASTLFERVQLRYLFDIAPSRNAASASSQCHLYWTE
eukprot:3636642-Amphidinium_carterae.1